MFVRGPALDHWGFGSGEEPLGEEGASGSVAPQGPVRPGFVPRPADRCQLGATTQMRGVTGTGALWRWSQAEACWEGARADFPRFLLLLLGFERMKVRVTDSFVLPEQFLLNFG